MRIKYWHPVIAPVINMIDFVFNKCHQALFKKVYRRATVSNRDTPKQLVIL